MADPIRLAPTIPGGDRMSIDGGATWSNIVSLDFENAGPITESRGSAAQNRMYSASRRAHKPVEIVKIIDATSPTLLKASTSGRTIPQVDIRMRGAEYTFSNVVIQSLSLLAKSDADTPRERVSFVYQRLVFTLVPGGKATSDEWHS